MKCSSGWQNDVVRAKETVTVTPNFEDDPIEIKADWRGTIVLVASNLEEV